MAGFVAGSMTGSMTVNGHRPGRRGEPRGTGAVRASRRPASGLARREAEPTGTGPSPARDQKIVRRPTEMPVWLLRPGSSTSAAPLALLKSTVP